MKNTPGFISGWISICRSGRRGAGVTLAVAILTACFGATNASAQTVTVCSVSPCPMQTNKAFQVAADHDGIDTDKLTIYINGTLYASAPVSALTGGVITFNVAGLAKGTYVIYIEASGEGGATPSDSITVQVTPGKPSKPRNIRVLVG
jgi:hypothetical protein